jgi:hypothetical protein
MIIARKWVLDVEKTATDDRDREREREKKKWKPLTASLRRHIYSHLLAIWRLAWFGRNDNARFTTYSYPGSSFEAGTWYLLDVLLKVRKRETMPIASQ